MSLGIALIFLGVTLLFWAISVIWMLRSWFANDTNQEEILLGYARERGLRLNKELTLSGEIDGLPVSVSIDRVNLSESMVSVIRVVVGVRSLRWAMVRRDHIEEGIKGPPWPLELPATAPTGVQTFDQRYQVVAEGELPFLGWENSIVPRLLAEADLALAIAGPDGLDVRYHNGGRETTYKSASAVRRALLTTLSLLRQDRLLQYLPEILEPPPRRPFSLPAPNVALAGSILTGLVAPIFGLQIDWRSFFAGACVGYLPFFVLGLGLDRGLRHLQARRSRGRDHPREQGRGAFR